MPRRFMAMISKEEKWYVAHCVEPGVVSQGKTIEESKANLQDAVELYLESFSLSSSSIGSSRARE